MNPIGQRNPRFSSVYPRDEVSRVYASGLAIAQNDSEVVVDWVRESTRECVLFILAGLNLSRFLGNGSDQGNCREKGLRKILPNAPHNQRESRCCSILCIDIRLFHDSTCLVRTIRQSG